MQNVHVDIVVAPRRPDPLDDALRESGQRLERLLRDMPGHQILDVPTAQTGQVPVEVSDSLIRMIPDGSRRQELLDEQSEEIGEPTHLLEIMKLFVHPMAQSDLHRTNDIYDDLCAAAEKMGLHW